MNAEKSSVDEDLTPPTRELSSRANPTWTVIPSGTDLNAKVKLNKKRISEARPNVPSGTGGDLRK
jgi:hypothetical protein